MKEESESLSETLAVSPLLHLVPSQDLALLAGPSVCVPHVCEHEVRDFMSAAIDEDSPDAIEPLELLKYIPAENFASFNDKELSEVKFPDLLVHTGDFSFSSIKLEPQLEILCESNEYSPSFQNTRNNALFLDTEHLLVRRRNVGAAYLSSSSHSQRYAQKFEQECSKLTLSFDERESIPPHGNKISKVQIRPRRKVALSIDKTVAMKTISDYTKKMETNIWSDTAFHINILSEMSVILSKSGIAEAVMKNRNLRESLFEKAHAILSLDCSTFCREIIAKLSSDDSISLLDYIKSRFDSLTIMVVTAQVVMTCLSGSKLGQVLFVEGIVQSVGTLFRDIAIGLVLPCVKLSVKLPDLNGVLQVTTKFAANLANLVNAIADYSLQGTLNERILSSFELSCLLLTFRETVALEKNYSGGATIIPVTILDSAAAGLLTHLFWVYSYQRASFLENILDQIEIKSLEVPSRDVALEVGESVQLSSVILIRMVQTVDNPGVEMDRIETKLGMPLRSAQWVQSIEKLMSEALATPALYAAEIASHLMSIATRKENSRKLPLELLTRDLLRLLTSPDWPGSILIVKAITYLATQMINAPKELAATRIFCTELLKMTTESLLATAQAYQLNMSQWVEVTRPPVSESKLIEVLQSLQACGIDSDYKLMSLKLISMMFLKKALQKKVPSIQGEYDTAVAKEDNEITSCESVERLLAFHDSILNYLLGNSTQRPSRKLLIDYNRIMFLQDMLPLFNMCLTALFAAVAKAGSTETTKVLRLLSALLEKEPMLISSHQIQQCVISKLRHQSPSVRSSVLDLLSGCMSLMPDLVKAYWDVLREFFLDKSAAVRKQILQMAANSAAIVTSRETRSSILSSILELTADENMSIRNQASDCLETAWVKPFQGSASHNDLQDAAHSIIDVLNLGVKSSVLLDAWLCSVLGKDNKRVAELRAIVACLFDILVEAEESGNSRLFDFALATISLFARIDNSLIGRTELNTLLPYIVADQTEAALAITYYALQILDCALESTTSLPRDFANHVQAALLKGLTKYHNTTLEVAVPCLWKISDLTKTTEKVVTALIYCLTKLRAWATAKSEDDSRKICAVLRLVGYLGKHCSLEAHRQLFMRLQMGLGETESIASLLVRYLLIFSKTEWPEVVHASCLTGIFSICQSHNRILLSKEVSALLDRDLLGDSELLRSTIFNCLTQFLRHENSSKRTSGDSTRFGSSLASTNQELGASVVQLYKKHIFDACLQGNSSTERAGLSFVEASLEYGFLPPNECISTIIALDANPRRDLASLWQKIHTETWRKHESLTSGNYREALKSAAEYRQRVCPGENYLADKYFLDRQYQLVNSSRKLREKLLNSVTAIMQTHFEIDDLAKSKDTVDFLAINLAHITFKSQQEVATIILTLRQTVSKDGFDLVCHHKDYDTDTIEPVDVFEALRIMCIASVVQFLTARYNISQEQLASLDPDRMVSHMSRVPKIDEAVNYGPYEVDADAFQDADKRKNIWRAFLAMMADYS